MVVWHCLLASSGSFKHGQQVGRATRSLPSSRPRREFYTDVLMRDLQELPHGSVFILLGVH